MSISREQLEQSSSPERTGTARPSSRRATESDRPTATDIAPSRSRSERQRIASLFLLCRTLGHAWFPVPADGPGAHGGDPLWLHCERCDTERHDSVSRSTGDLIGRNYVYPGGYKEQFADDFRDAPPTRADFRRMLLEAHLDRRRNLRAMQGGK